MRALVDEFLRERFRRDPVLATYVGTHDHDGELGDHSGEAYLDRESAARSWERRFAAVPEASLDAAERTDRDFVLAELRGEQVLAQSRPWARLAPTYVQVAMRGVYTLVCRDFAPAEERFARIAERLARTPAVVAAARANLEAERTAPVHVVVAGEAAAGAASFVRAELPSIAPEGPAKRDVILAGREAAAALDAFAGWLRDDLMPRARGSFAIGRDHFDALLRRRHLLRDDAAALVRRGRDAFAETRARLEETAGEDWSRAIAELVRAHPDVDGLLDAYRREAARARDGVRALAIAELPETDEVEVAATPAYQRPIVPYVDYFPPAPFESGRRGYLYVTVPEARGPTADLEQRLQGHATAGIPVFAVHQAYPGHHLQLVRAADHASAVRKVFSSPLLVEGWGLYCEELMAEAGYLDDRGARLLQLRGLLVRAARVIVDVGLATGELNFEQAVNLLIEGARLERPNAIAEVRRYTLDPTQAMSCLIGRDEIVRLRERARGKGLRAFHDRLLAVGSVPPALAARELGF